MEEYREEKYGNNEKIKRKISRKWIRVQDRFN